MELPRGLQKQIICPVVKEYQDHKGRLRTLERPQPDKYLGLKFNPDISMSELEKFWTLSAIEHCGGSLFRAAKMLGVSKETVYRRVRTYNEEK